MTVSFDIPREAKPHLDRIVNRTVELCAILGFDKPDVMSLRMDLCACHANGMPLNWPSLAYATDLTLAHDVFGIMKHIDRETGKLANCFVPRLALKEEVA